MKRVCLEKKLFIRQYDDKCKFRDYNALIKNMRCNKVLCFSSFPVQNDFQNQDVPISTCKFSNKNKEISAIANENGIVCIQNVKKLKQYSYLQTHTNTVYDIAWMPGSLQFITVSGDNSAKLWDCAESNVRLVSVFKGHKRSVRCVTFKPENTAVFATGSRDGSLMIWDARAQQKCAKFSHHLPDQIIPSAAGSTPAGQKFAAKKPGTSAELLNCKSVTGVVFQNDNTLISCGSLDNVIRIWDMRKTYSRSTSNSIAKHQLYSPYSGFSYLCMNSAQNKLYTNCMDSYIYCFNINSYDPEPVAAFYGHENGSFYVKSSLSFDGTYLMSGSSDETAYIWNTKGAELSDLAVKPFVTLSSHLAEVTCVEMCPDNLVIVTCSDDGTFRLWNSLITEECKTKRVDMAEYYDEGKIATVKTQWKNKRKIIHIEEPPAKESKIGDELLHRQICRFYTSNFSLSCICEGGINRKTGLKRQSEERLLEMSPAKKKTVFGNLEDLQNSKENSNTLLQSEAVSNTHLYKQNRPVIKLSFKRKLENMPNFSEEYNKNKKINYDRALIPCNIEENDKNKNTQNSTCYSNKCQIFDRNELKENCKKKFLVEISSPTSNLPNYIEDGTSPYIHKCSRLVQKENDWLRKLQEIHCKEKSSGLQKSLISSNTVVNTQQQHKKKLKQNDHTLHKYFKVSSKTTDKSYNLQEIQKKSILIQ